MLANTTADVIVETTAATAAQPWVLYGVFMLYPLAVFPDAVSAGGSIASAYTAISALAALLMIAYHALGILSFYTSQGRFDIEPSLIAASASLFALDFCRGLLLSTYPCGLAVMMLVRVLRDAAVFITLAASLTLTVALALFFYDTSAPSAVATSEACPFVEGSFSSYLGTMQASLLSFDISTADDQINCFRQRGLPGSMLILAAYVAVSAIVLVNMLIAMMSESLVSNRAALEEKYKGISAQMVLAADVKQGDIPLPLNVLRIPSVILKALSWLCFSWRDDDSAYERLLEANIGKVAFANVNAAVLMERMSEFEEQAGKMALEELQKEMVESKERRAEVLALFDVKAYKGFTEKVHRLIFHYGDKFTHLVEQPELRWAISADGVGEGKVTPLPVRREHEFEAAKGGSGVSLATHALASYAKPQDVEDELLGERIIAELGDTFVFRRGDGSIGITQPWRVEYDEAFHEDFECDYINPDPAVFKVQAVVEFERTVCKLFGADATKRGTIVFAKQSRDTNEPVFVGPALALATYLREHPETVEHLKIAKLLPDGFVAIRVTYDGGELRHDYKQVTWPKDRTQHCAVYIQQSSEVHATITPLDEFNEDCTLHEEVSTTDLWSA